MVGWAAIVLALIGGTWIHFLWFVMKSEWAAMWRSVLSVVVLSAYGLAQLKTTQSKEAGR